VIHGFPSWSSKNYDIAEHLCLMGYEVFVPHHKGLGLSKGDFSFKRSITDVKKLISLIKKEKPTLKISLLGHSWGGFVSLHLHQYVEEHLILLAPLLEVPGSSQLKQFINYFFSNHPVETKKYNRLSLKKEFVELQKNFILENFIKNLKERKFLILHGTEDDLIPINHSTKFAKKISKELSCDYIRMDEDHRLTKKRNLVFAEINTWLKANRR
jgi:alpha-beta hydrolase superfamily lysophospholipase